MGREKVIFWNTRFLVTRIGRDIRLASEMTPYGSPITRAHAACLIRTQRKRENSGN